VDQKMILNSEVDIFCSILKNLMLKRYLK